MRVLVLSDIHGNSIALKEIIENESYDAVWFLGDLTDYGPNPDEVLEILKDLKPEVWVSGNHDYANAFNVDCHCGEKTHELSVYTRENMTKKLLSEEDIKFLQRLPIRQEKEIGGKNFYFVHACPKDPLYGYMFDFDPECMVNEIGRKIDVDVIVYGHTHFPRNGIYGQIAYFNPGSVGQPRDGEPLAAYGIYFSNEEKFELRRKKYDVDEVVKRIKLLGLEKKYEEMLVKILIHGSV